MFDRKLRIINVEELSKLESIDLNVFKDWLSSQIDHCKSILLEKWIPFVFKVVLRVRIDRTRTTTTSHRVVKVFSITLRLSVEQAVEKDFRETKKHRLNRFYDCLSTLMTLQLQNMYLQTMNEYTDFVCDPLVRITARRRRITVNSSNTT